MGPTILLDKSTLQSIKRAEASFLFKHYVVVITPVLFAEILADVKKGSDKSALTKDEVRWLADKLLSTDHYSCAFWKDLCIQSLLGNEVTIGLGQVPVTGGEEIVGPDGKKGIFFDEPAEIVALRNWQAGNFSEQELATATRWREMADGLDLESYKTVLRANTLGAPKVKSFAELKAAIDAFCEHPDRALQFELIQNYADDLRLNDETKKVIFDRWLKQALPSFKTFAPYAYYCFRVRLTFHLGLINHLIGTRPTNKIDLIYLYYLPFCVAFSSGDKIHADLAPMFLRDNQIFVSRDELKADLVWLNADWNALTPEQKTERNGKFGSL